MKNYNMIQLSWIFLKIKENLSKTLHVINVAFSIDLVLSLTSSCYVLTWSLKILEHHSLQQTNMAIKMISLDFMSPSFLSIQFWASASHNVSFQSRFSSVKIPVRISYNPSEKGQFVNICWIVSFAARQRTLILGKFHPLFAKLSVVNTLL